MLEILCLCPVKSAKDRCEDDGVTEEKARSSHRQSCAIGRFPHALPDARSHFFREIPPSFCAPFVDRLPRRGTAAGEVLTRCRGTAEDQLEVIGFEADALCESFRTVSPWRSTI
jgi:hypothetical protein